MPAELEIFVGDITTLAVDAIVNAANPRMLGGGGVDGAIHRAAGPSLYEECKQVPEVRPGVRCPTGEARITGGHRLPARYVIHTVGPVWSGGGAGEAELLSACYANCIRLAEEHKLKSIAFPAISTGAYAYPPQRAADVAIRAVRGALPAAPSIARIIFACFDEQLAAVYRGVLSAE